MATCDSKQACSRALLLCFAALVLSPVQAAEVELLRMGEYRIATEEDSCGEEVPLIIRAGRWEAFEKDAEIRQAASYAEYDVRQSGCKSFSAFRVKGYANNMLVYEGVAARADDWQPEGGILAAVDRSPTPAAPVGMFGPSGGSTTAREYLARMASVESPSMDARRCGPFTLRDPFNGSRSTTLRDAITRLAAGELDAVIDGGRYRAVLNDISNQRNEYDLRCKAAILLERDSICIPDDFDCAVVSACAQYAMAHVSDASRERFPSCIESSTRKVAEQRQQVLAARISVEGIATELIIAKLPGADERLGDWCGETLYAKLNWPQDFNVTPSLARTVSDILNESLSEACPTARRLNVMVQRFRQYTNRRAASRSEQFLRAYREDGAWNIAYHEDFLRERAASAKLESLFNTMKAIGSNPTSLGFAVAAGPLNAAMAENQRNRFAKYAREGKVCRMRDAVRHCYVSTTYETGYGGRIGRTMIITHTPKRWSSCREPCDFHDGYCNMETGARYRDAESAERANCRAASSEEIQAATAAANVSEAYPAYRYEILYAPWHQVPEL